MTYSFAPRRKNPSLGPTPSAFSPHPGGGAASAQKGAVLHSLGSLSILPPQAKLTMNTPGDNSEQGAKATDQIMRSVDRTPTCWENSVLPVSAFQVQREGDDVPDPPDTPSSREPDKPGGPTDWGNKGFTLGVGPGNKVTGGLDIGQGDPLTIPFSNPFSKPNGDQKPKGIPGLENCPKERQNLLWNTCCHSDQRYDPDSKNCVRDFSVPSTQTIPEAPLPRPDPAPAPALGDYPLPSGDTENA